MFESRYGAGRVVAAFCASLLTAVPAFAALGHIDNLGTLGGSFSQGHAINSAGQVAGRSNLVGAPLGHVFRYSGTPGDDGTMVDLGSLGTSFSVGYAINNSGQVAGYAITSTSDSHAFRYSGVPGNGGIMLDLGTLGGSDSFGLGINEAGQVAGYSRVASDSATHAFLYTEAPGIGGVMVDLGTLGGSHSHALGINDVGHVVGYSNTTGNVAQHAFLYSDSPSSGGVMMDLGTLGGPTSAAYAINYSGQITGSSAINSSVVHAFVYIDGVMADLGTLGGNSQGNAINSSGDIAGFSTLSSDPFAGSHAFLYIGAPGVDGIMVDLDTWLDAVNPIEGAKWTLTSATGLNDAGMVTGIGTFNDGPDGMTDGTRAFLLDVNGLNANTIPEPTAPSVFALVSLRLFRRRSRC